MSHSVVVWGASGHALVVSEIIRLVGEYDIIGFLDDHNSQNWNTEFCQSQILGGQEQLDKLASAGVKNIILAIGDCQTRLALWELARIKGFSLVTAIHPRASISSDVSIGAGTVIASGAVVNPGTRIGENVIINTQAGVDHECDIADGAHIGPGVQLGGRVRVGRGTWIGIGGVVADRIEIGSSSIIGAGAVVLHNVPDGVVEYGVPARFIRTTNSS